MVTRIASCVVTLYTENRKVVDMIRDSTECNVFKLKFYSISGKSRHYKSFLWQEGDVALINVPIPSTCICN